MFPSREMIRVDVRDVVARYVAVGGGAVGGVSVVAIARTFLRPVASEPDEVLGIGAATALSTALLSYLVVRHALARSEHVVSAALSGSMIAAIANVSLSIWTAGFGALLLAADDVPARASVVVETLLLGLVAGLFAALPGLVVSLPLGTVFALAYALVCRAAVPELEAPSQRSIARAHRLGATALVTAAAIVLGLAAALGAPIGVLVGLPAPLVLLATLGLLLARGEDARLDALVRDLRGDRHGRLVLFDPLLARVGPEVVSIEPGGGTHAVVARDGAAYRSRPDALAML